MKIPRESLCYLQILYPKKLTLRNESEIRWFEKKTLTEFIRNKSSLQETQKIVVRIIENNPKRKDGKHKDKSKEILNNNNNII